MTIIVRYLNTTHGEFEELRDMLFTNDVSSGGIISANYSPKKQIALFVFINESHIPPSLKGATMHHHPVEVHHHD